MALPDPDEHVHQLLPLAARRPEETELDEVEELYLFRRLGSRDDGIGRSAEDEALSWITDDEIKEALESLPESFRMTVLLADVEGFSYKEIAEIMEVPIGTVMSRLHRGRRALEKTLHDFGVARGSRRGSVGLTGRMELG